MSFCNYLLSVLYTCHSYLLRVLYTYHNFENIRMYVFIPVFEIPI
jgi:hypothetical protein